LVVIFLSSSFAAQTYHRSDTELKKAYSKEYSADKNTVVEISNRYGTVDVKSWTNNAVKIDVTVIVKAGNQSKAEAKMKEINIMMSKNGNNVVANTEISSTNQSWWESWWGSTGSIKIEINYIVYMPSHLQVMIENKYGNIYLPDLSGKTSINLKYGNLQAQNISADLLMDLSYGKATFGNVKNLKGTISYSDIRGTAADAVMLTTKYSKIYIDNIKSLIATSKYDTYKIGNTNTVTMTGAYDDIDLRNLASGTFNLKYTGMEIASLSNSITTEISYGSMTIENLKTSFKQMVVNTSYAPIKVYGSVPCKVDVSGKYFDADLGADFVSKEKVNEGNTKMLKGYKGSERTGASITIASKYGDVVLK